MKKTKTEKLAIQKVKSSIAIADDYAVSCWIDSVGAESIMKATADEIRICAACF